MKALLLCLLTFTTTAQAYEKIASWSYESPGEKTLCTIYKATDGSLHANYKIKVQGEEYEMKDNLPDLYDLAGQSQKIIGAPFTTEAPTSTTYQTLFTAHGEGMDTPVFGLGKKVIIGSSPLTDNFVVTVDGVCGRFGLLER